MSDVERYISARKQADPEFAAEFETGYHDFEIGILLKQAREAAGLTQEQLADRIGTKKDGYFSLGEPRRGHQTFHAAEGDGRPWPPLGTKDSVIPILLLPIPQGTHT